MKVLVVGYGSIGKRHIGNLSSLPNLEILVYTNRRIDQFLKKKKCRVFNSLERCLEEKPQIALITNVTSLHIKTAIRLAKSGVDLFIEKPLSHSMKGIKELSNIIQKKKLITLIGCNLRFHPCIRKINEMVLNKEIGRVISVRVENSSFLPDWHKYEDYRNSYASREDMGGGVVLTNIHEIDYLYWFFGSVKEVFSVTGKFSDLDIDVEDFASILLRFRNNIIAEIHLDFFQRPSFRSCKIIGTKGTIYWDSEINAVKVYNVRNRRWIQKLKLKNYDNNSMYIEEMNYFIKCVKARQKTINSVKDGVQTLKIALAAKNSSKTRRLIKPN